MTAAQLPVIRRPGAGRTRRGGTRVERRCQDRPPWPVLAGSHRLVYPQVERAENDAPRRRCRVPGDSGVSVRKCQGWGLGYDSARVPTHGPDFLVCVNCARKNGETYGWSRNLFGVDACLDCSRHWSASRLPGPEPTECICHIKRVDLKVHLCTECRMEQRRREHERVVVGF